MSDEKPFAIEKAKTGRASCKKCKQKLESGELRIAKLVANYFSDSGMMKHWHHIDCLFQAFKTQKATTKKIDSIEDVEGFGDLTAEEQDEILEKLFQATGKRLDKTPIVNKTSSDDVETQGNFKTDSNDNLLSTFINITEKIASESGYKAKSELLNKFLTKGSNKKVFEGDVGLWIKLLLPGTGKRVYNLQSKQLIKIFSRVFNTNQEEMLIDLEQGDVSETIKKYCDLSKKVDSEKSSSLTLQEVDKFLDELTTVTKEDEQTDAFSKLCEKANSDDLKIVIRLIKHDLKTTAGPRHILDALDLQAYAAFKNSNNLQAVVDKFSPLLRKNRSTENSSETEPKPKKLKPNLRKFMKGIPIFIVEYHHEVVEFIYRCIGSRYLPFEGIMLIHFDSHPDMVINTSTHPSTAFNKELLLSELSIENWIMPLCYSGQFNNLIWLKNSWCTQMEVGEYDFFIGDNETEIKVSSDQQYFVSEANYCSEERLRNKKKIKLSVRNADDNNCEFVTIDDDVSYILDVDLDFFSTANPFLTIYDKADCYAQLKPIFTYDSQGLSVDEVADRRQKQIVELSDVFEYLKEHNCLDGLDNSEKMYDIRLLEKLVSQIQLEYPDEEIDWEIVFNSGLTCDNDGLPHHISSPKELEQYFLNFENILRNLPKDPTVVCISRSSIDNYCPGVVVDEIQERVLGILEDVFDDRLNDDPVLYYEDDDCSEIFKN